MMRNTHWIISGLLAMAAFPAIAKQPAVAIPPSVQARIDAIERHAGSNDMAAIQREVAQIEWRDVSNPKAVCKSLAKALPKGKVGKELRRELKTKYELLREDDSELAELADTQSYAVRIVRVPSITVELIVVSSLPIDSLEFLPMTIDVMGFYPVTAAGLAVPVVASHGMPVPWILCRNVTYDNAMSAWERRWNTAMDAMGPSSVRIIPHPATELGRRRAELMAQIEKVGWTAETESAWAQYYADLAAALGRRTRLQKQK